jgi:hypothetical protein
VLWHKHILIQDHLLPNQEVMLILMVILTIRCVCVCVPQGQRGGHGGHAGEAPASPRSTCVQGNPSESGR